MLGRYINIMILLASTVLFSGCVHRSSGDPPAVSITPQSDDRHVLAGEWEYIDGSGAAFLLTLDGEGNGHYDWKHGRFETRMLIDHMWTGMWFQEANDREGGFMVEFSQDFSEGEGQWWYAASEQIVLLSKRVGRFI
jgi:hypothetical protein